MGLEMNAFRFGNAKYYYSKSFQQAFGNINPQKAAEAYYNAKEREEGTLLLIS